MVINNQGIKAIFIAFQPNKSSKAPALKEQIKPTTKTVMSLIACALILRGWTFL